MNIPTEVKSFCSRYSVSIYAEDTPIKKIIISAMSNDPVPRPGDTVNSLLRRQISSDWCDELHTHRRGCTHGRDCPHGKNCSLANGDVKYMSPMRRTKSICLNRPYTIEDTEDPDYGAKVTDQYSYQCHEMPVAFWSSRPMTQGELAFILEIWLEAWPFSTSISRKYPPNWLQYVDYAATLDCNMGMHRDNNTKQGLVRMQQGLPPHEDQARIYAGVPNSQVVGSCVYVYTTGNAPMKMVWSFPDISSGPDQNVKKYIEVDCLMNGERAVLLC